MIHRVLSSAVCLAALFLAGCCCPRDGTPVPCDPLREIGVDCRGLLGPDAVAAGERQVLLDMTIARIPEARVVDALGADRPRAQGAPRKVSAGRARALVTAWRKEPAVEITSAPKLLALPGQQASVFIGEVVRFARTVASETGEVSESATLDGETVRYRKTTAVTNQEGGLEFSIEEDAHSPVDLGMQIVVVASPSPSADGHTVSLELAGSWRELKQELSPEATAKMTAAEFETHVREHRLDARFETQHDAWVVVGNPAWIETDAGRVLQVVLLHTVLIGGDAKRTQE